MPREPFCGGALSERNGAALEVPWDLSMDGLMQLLPWTAKKLRDMQINPEVLAL